MKIFILEDNNKRMEMFYSAFVNHQILASNSAGIGVEAINEGVFVPGIIFLDHDLGGEIYVNTEEKNTGSSFCKNILEKHKDVPVIIHSANIVGANNMKAILKDKGFEQVIQSAFGYDEFNKIVTDIMRGRYEKE